jgi:hypothetical protein
MAKKLDDIYRKSLWYTNLTTNDFPYVYSSGGAYGFLEAFHDVYNNLIGEIVSTGGDHFMEKATFNLQANQQEYIFPADLIKFRELELSYDGVGWARARHRDLSLLPSTEAGTLSSASVNAPLFDIIEDSYFLYPEPSTTVSSGGKLWYIKAPAESLFISAVSAASATITFPQQYEKLLSLGVATEMWGKFGTTEKEPAFIQKYKEGVEKMKHDMQPRTRTAGARVIDGNRELTHAN